MTVMANITPNLNLKSELTSINERSLISLITAPLAAKNDQNKIGTKVKSKRQNFQNNYPKSFYQ